MTTEVGAGDDMDGRYRRTIWVSVGDMGAETEGDIGADVEDDMGAEVEG